MNLPATLAGYVVRLSGRHQVALAALSVLVFLLTAVPLELQRRIVNDAVYSGAYGAIAGLAATYLAVVLAEGLLKLALNVYRGWVSENAVRQLRRTALAAGSAKGAEGVELSMVLSEVEPIGGFVGVAVSEPLLQGGILLSVFGYLVVLHPWLAALSFAVFAPQLVFVPLLQAAINRRVERRVLTMRAVSDGIVREGGTLSAASAAQHDRIDRVFVLHMGMYQLKFTMNFLMNLTHHAGVVAVLALGSWYALNGRVEIGTVVAFISGLGKLNDPWGDVVNWFRDMTANRVKYRLVREAIERMQAPPAAPLTYRKTVAVAGS